MRSDCFIDTNIWVYAFLESEKDSRKQAAALALLRSLSAASRIVVSAQVINEFHWTLARKYAIADSIIHDKVENGIARLADIVPLDYATYRDSHNLRTTCRLSFWDSLIVASALHNGCATLYSEDLAHNMVIHKTLRITNPFV